MISRTDPVIPVNKYYHYYDFLLKEWKNKLAADEPYITVKLNKIAICFKIRAV